MIIYKDKERALEYGITLNFSFHPFGLGVQVWHEYGTDWLIAFEILGIKIAFYIEEY